jgi:multiple sugar transport system substrate-binding protein
MKKLMLVASIFLVLVSIIAAETVLEYWIWDPDLKDRTMVMIEKFEAENPDISVNLTVMEPGDYWTKLRLMAMTKRLPDVFNLSSGYIEEWSSKGFLLPLDEYIENSLDQDSFYMNLFEAEKQLANSDSYYAVPFALVTTVLFFNKDMFDAAGLEYPNSQWRWEEFLETAKKLTIDKDSDGKIDQWGFWLYGRYAHIESWIFRNDGKLIDRETMRFAPDKNAVDTLEFLTDLVTEYEVAPEPKEMAGVRQQDVFPRQIAAMWVDGSWNIDNNRIIAGDEFNWGIAEVPMGPAGKTDSAYGWPDFVAISKTTNAPEAAWKFAKFAGGEGLTLDMYMPGKIPSYKSLAESEAFYTSDEQPEEMKLLLEIAAKEMKSSFTMSWGEWRGYGAAEGSGLNSVLDSILNGDMTFEEGLEKMDTSINKILEKIYE